MKRIKVSPNFYLDEFIDPVTYDRFGAKSQRYIEPNIIKAAQYLRGITGLSITINNWATDGAYKESGLRNFETSTGAKYSAHKFGRAADLKIGDLSSFEMWELIKANTDVLMNDCGILRVEAPEFTMGKHRSWIHVDTLFNGGLNEIILIKP